VAENDLPIRSVVVRCPGCEREPGRVKLIEVSVMHGIVTRAACSRGCGTLIEASYDEKDVLHVRRAAPPPEVERRI